MSWRLTRAWSGHSRRATRGTPGHDERECHSSANRYTAAPLSRRRLAVFEKFINSLRGKLSPVTPEFRTRLKHIDTWLDSMSLFEAKAIALGLLARSEWFTTTPPDPTVMLPENMPDSVVQLFEAYGSLRGRFCDLRCDANEIAPSTVHPQFLHIGWNDSHTELCTRGREDTVSVLANDVPAEEALEGTSRSVYHSIVRMGAILEYVVPPQAAV
jgi:hypothetical protein